MDELMKPHGFEEDENTGDTGWQRSGALEDNEERPAGKYDEKPRMYASDDDDKDDDDDDDDEEQLEGGLSEWGDIDPQSNPGPFPDPNEPTAPGSAV